MTDARTTLPPELDRILRATSRSIYLTLRVVPLAVRRQLMLAYLFCRAADTIADTRVLPRERRIEMLSLYRSLFESELPDRGAIAELSRLADDGPGEGFTAAEAELLRELAACFHVHAALVSGDRALMRRLLTTLTVGMQTDLETFPGEELAGEDGELLALDDDAALDRYCYHVAGCVGEFWTDLQCAHLDALRGLDRPVMRDLGVRFGKGLQLTNILRDMPDDLRIGRCYIPRSRLEARAVAPEDLRAAMYAGEAPSGLVEAMRPILDALLDLTREHFRSGWRYTLALPRRIPRLRMACALPLMIGLGTVRELHANRAALLAGRRIKVPRSEVYRLMASSAGRIFSNSLMARLYDRLEREARGQDGTT